MLEKIHFLKLALGLLFVFISTNSHAQMAIKGKLILSEDFKASMTYTNKFQPAPDGWNVRVMHGNWKRSSEGIESTWTSGHMPVLAYEGNFKDAVIELEFRYQLEPENLKTTHPAKEEPKINKGQCRISANSKLNPRAYAVSSWANAGSAERPLGVVLEHDEYNAKKITTVARQMAKFEPNTWYPMRLEIIGDYALVSCNGVTLSGTQEKFGLPKSAVVLGTGYCPHEFRKLRVYEATANPAWVKPAATPAVNLDVKK